MTALRGRGRLSMDALRRAFAEPKAAHRLMLGIVLLMLVANALWGERLMIGNGLGWDGVTYAGLVRNLDDTLGRDLLGSYYAQRLLPPFVVRQALLLLHAPLSDRNIIVAFGVMNALLMLALAEIWRRICDMCALPVAGRWIGFTALFVNFQFSKQSMFYPVLTDVVALVLSALLLLLYLKRQRIGVALVGVAGAFCWPTLGITAAALLLAMPRAPVDACAPVADVRLAVKRTWIVLAALLMAAIVVAVSPIGYGLCTASGLPGLFEHLPGGVRAALARNDMRDACVIAQQAATALPALTLAALAILVLCWPLLRGVKVRAPSAFRIQSALLAIAVLALGWLGVRFLSNPAVPNPSGVVLLAKLVLLPAPGKLLLPLVSAASFWGPFVVFLALCWPRLSVAARSLGPGVAIVIAFTLPFGLVGEPRFLTTIWPMLALLSATLLAEGRPRAVILVLLAASFLLAQFWLPLNLMPWVDRGGYDDLRLLPKQLYFMHYGLWMGWPAYLGQAVLFAALGVWLWRERGPTR